MTTEQEILDRVDAILCRHSPALVQVPITMDTALFKDLGQAWSDQWAMWQVLNGRFSLNVKEEDVVMFRSVRDVVRYIEAQQDES